MSPMPDPTTINVGRPETRVQPTYTRIRMVKLAPYLTADSISAYCADEIDGDNVSAIFEPSELENALDFRRSINPRLFALLQG